jgi:hypothetical protein
VDGDGSAVGPVGVSGIAVAGVERPAAANIG